MKKRILLVDDDAFLNKVNQVVLSRAGLASELHIVTNGKLAIDFLKNQIATSSTLPNLIILDLNMPVMNGFEFLDEYNNLDFPEKSNIEIVMFTDSSNPGDKRRLSLKGIRYFVDKPYILRGLTDILSGMQRA